MLVPVGIDALHILPIVLSQWVVIPYHFLNYALVILNRVAKYMFKVLVVSLSVVQLYFHIPFVSV